MYSKTDENPVETWWQKGQKPEFYPIWKPQMTWKFGPIRPIFYTHPKLAATSRLMKFHVNPWKIFPESTRKLTFWPNFYLFGSPKWPKNRASEAQLLHASKSKARSMWMQWKLFDKIVENLIPKFEFLEPIFYTPRKSAATSLEIKFHVNPMNIVRKNSQKPTFWPILAQFGAKKRTKIWPTEAIFHTYLKEPTMCL